MGISRQSGTKNKSHMGHGNSMNNIDRRTQRGFSLIELIVVIAIMSALIALVAPQFLKYVARKRNETCRHNRESMLRIYEREVYDNRKTLTTADIQVVIPDEKSKIKNRFKGDLEQYYECPNSVRAKKNSDHNFVANIDADNQTAYIECAECGDIVSIDFLGWGNGKRDPGEDPERKVKEPETLTSEEEPTSSEEESSSEEENFAKDSSAWPYPDDPKWWDANQFTHADDCNDYSLSNTGNTSYVSLKSPSGIFTARSGAQFVYVGDTSNPDYKIYLYEASSPEVYSAKHSQFLIQLTGSKYTYDITGYDTNGKITTASVAIGDLIEFTDRDRGQSYLYVCMQEGYSTYTLNGNEIEQVRNYQTHVKNFRAVNEKATTIK